MQEVDQRITLAREYLAAARGRDIDRLPPSRLMTELAETRRQLGQMLAVVAEREGEHAQLAEIRAVLAAFDWEFDDRQLALEHIERRAGGES
jgi:hypothetical protein